MTATRLVLTKSDASDNFLRKPLGPVQLVWLVKGYIAKESRKQHYGSL